MTALRPEGRRFWIEHGMIPLDRQGLPSPNFTVHETAKLFFAKSSSWLRLIMRVTEEYPLSRLVLDGKPMDIRRKRGNDSARLFTLADIEPMAYSIFEFALAEIDAERKALGTSQPAEMQALELKQAQIVSKLPRESKQRIRLSTAHGEQRKRLAEKHAAQLAALDKRRAAQDVQLDATIAIVKGVGRLYGILGPES